MPGRGSLRRFRSRLKHVAPGEPTRHARTPRQEAEGKSHPLARARGVRQLRHDVGASSVWCGSARPVWVLGCSRTLLPDRWSHTGEGRRHRVRRRHRGGCAGEFYSGVFIKDGEVEIEVLNRADAPLSFAAAPPVVSDGEGRTLKTSNCMYQKWTSQTTGMDAQTNGVVAKGQRAIIMCFFPVR